MRRGEPSSNVLVKDRVPRNGKGVDNLLAQLTQYLHLPENKFTQKIVVDATRSYIYIEKLVPKDQAPAELGMTWHDAVRQVPMDELGIEKGTNPTPHQYLDRMFQEVTRTGYEVALALIGKRSDIFKWLDLPRASAHVFGTPLQVVEEIPDDVIILCGAGNRECDPEEIVYAVKGTML